MPQFLPPQDVAIDGVDIDAEPFQPTKVHNEAWKMEDPNLGDFTLIN